jgi:NAD(P)-dependent dehydrogenase (short-subunit alcohol dehydrogenase family)
MVNRKNRYPSHEHGKKWLMKGCPMKNVIVVIGAGSTGQAIVRRVSADKLVFLADIRQENTDMAARILIDAGFNVATTTFDVSSRASVHALVEAAPRLGEVCGLIHAAGVSPSQASPETILKSISTELRSCWRISATSLLVEALES